MINAAVAILFYPMHIQDSKLSEEFIHVRHVRLADGPDIVHLRTIAKEELQREPSPLSKVHAT